MPSNIVLKPIPLPSTSPLTATLAKTAAASPPSLYAPTSLPPSLPAGVARRPIRIRADGKCEACVCEICICGTHHCPPTPRHLAGREEKEPLPLSHSHTAYPPPPPHSFPTRAIKPPMAIAGGGDWEGASHYASEYHPHAFVAATPPAKLTSPPLFDTSAPLQSTTTSKAEYRRHPLPEKTAQRVPDAFTSAGTFEGASTYHSTFPVHLVEPPVPFRPSHALSAQCDEDRHFLSDAASNYRGQQGERRARLPPSHAMQGARTLGEGDDDGRPPLSESAAQYVHHRGVRVEAQRPSPPAYSDDDGEAREMRSEAMTQYGRKGRANTVAAIRPLPALGCSDEPFQGRSVAQDSYGAIDPAAYDGKVWGGREEAKVQCEADDRTWQTETRSHYQRKSVTPTRALPDVRRGVAFDGEGAGEWDTESRRRYRDHGDCRREGAVPLMARSVEGGRFEGLSEAREAYRGGGAERRALMRPVDALKEREADDRQWVSESRYHFQEKTMDPCPAAELEDRARKERHGHLFYEKEVHEKKWRRMYTGVQRSSALW